MKDKLSFAAVFIPLIVMAALLTFATFATIVVLLFDLIEKGCLAWHRDSLGLLLQKMIFCVCFLLTIVYLHQYVAFLETGDYDAIAAEEMTVVGCVTPLIVFLAMACCKLVCFKINNLATWVMVCLALISLIIVLYFRFGDPGYAMPLYVMAIPLSIFLLACPALNAPFPLVLAGTFILSPTEI